VAVSLQRQHNSRIQKAAAAPERDVGSAQTRGGVLPGDQAERHLLEAGGSGQGEAYAVEATPSDGGAPEKLYFDAQTGLLRRKYSEAKTFLGQFPTQTGYEDYREVDGVKLPFAIRWSIPGRAWGRKIAEVKQNVPLDDARFDPPAEGN